jgi:hypothetical protein
VICSDENVLAVVDDITGFVILIRIAPPSKPRGSFDERDLRAA